MAFSFFFFKFIFLSFSLSPIHAFIFSFFLNLFFFFAFFFSLFHICVLCFCVFFFFYYSHLKGCWGNRKSWGVEMTRLGEASERERENHFVLLLSLSLFDLCQLTFWFSAQKDAKRFSTSKPLSLLLQHLLLSSCFFSSDGQCL